MTSDKLAEPPDIRAVISLSVGPHVTKQLVHLDGTRSIGPTDMRFEWDVRPIQSAGQPRVGDAGKARARFYTSQAGEYDITLTVSFGTASSSATDRVTVDEDPDPVKGASDDERWWQQTSLESRRFALGKVQDVAQKWQTVLATILGLFGAVAFVTAPKALENLPPGRAGASVVLVLVAFGFALSSLLHAVGAAQRAPFRRRGLTGRELKTATSLEFERAYDYLRNARIFALLAIITIVAGILLVWSVTIFVQSERPATLAIVRAGGQVYCGKLVTPAEVGQPLLLDDSPIPGVVEEVSVVTTCPQAAATKTWLGANEKALQGAGVALAILLAATLGWFLWERILIAGVVILATFALAAILRSALIDISHVSAIAAAVAASAAIALGLGMHRIVDRVVSRL